VAEVSLARCLAVDPSAGDQTASSPLEDAIAILDTSVAYPEARLEAHALRAESHHRRGDQADAIADMVLALSLVDSVRARRGGGDDIRTAFLAERQDLYDLMVSWRLESGDVSGAFEAHEHARARLLLDQISGSGVNLRAGIAPEVLAPLEA